MSGCTTKIVVVTKQGEKGSAGTNAFKFIKEFNTDSNGTVITVTLAEMVACGALPAGCLSGGIPSSVADLNVQVWTKNNSLGQSYFQQAIVGIDVSDTVGYIRIDSVTGLISTVLTSGHNDVTTRIVVLG